MGWRTDDAYERTREAEERQWIASLAPHDRLRLRVWQAWRMALLVLGLAALYGFLLEAHFSQREDGQPAAGEAVARTQSTGAASIATAFADTAGVLGCEIGPQW